MTIKLGLMELRGKFNVSPWGSLLGMFFSQIDGGWTGWLARSGWFG